MDAALINRLESFAADAKRGGSMADDEIADAIRALIDFAARMKTERATEATVRREMCETFGEVIGLVTIASNRLKRGAYAGGFVDEVADLIRRRLAIWDKDVAGLDAEPKE